MNEIAARIQNLIVGVFAAVILVSVVAYTQNQDEKDDRAVRAQQVASK